MKGLCRMIWLGLLIFFTFGHAVAQSSGIARLREWLSDRQKEAGFQQDTAYIDTLNTLAHAYYAIDADSILLYGKQALACSQKLAYAKGQSESWRLIGNGYKLRGDYTNMLACYYQSLAIAEKIRDPSLQAKANMNIAIFYDEVGKYDEALVVLERAARICQSTGDSLQYAYVLSNISDLWFRQQQYGKALAYEQHALQIAEGLKDEYTAAFLNNSMGSLLAVKGQYRESLVHHLQSMDYYRKTRDKLGQTETSALLAHVYLLNKNYPEALRYAQQSMALATEIKGTKQMQEAGQVLADIYEAKRDYQPALKYFKLYKDYSDSLFNEQTRKKTFELEARYEYERKEARLKEEEAKKDAEHEHLVRTQTLQRFLAGLLILFLSILAFVLFRSRASKLHINQLLQLKNGEIGHQKEELEHQAVQLLLNNQQKDKLFSIIAHDLKGPLNSLKGLLDLLKEKTLSESEINGMMAELRRNVDYSAELVSNLLFWASSQMNGIVVTPVVLAMPQMIADILNLFVKQAAEKKITILSETSIHTLAYADKDMIQVVIRNLISNAIKFCRQGDTITIQCRREGDFVETCVADTGIGIKEELLEKIRRRESVTTYGTAKEKGTGLGMLLCREFTEENKGRFWIESRLGEGSRFYFAIPVAPSSSSISE